MASCVCLSNSLKYPRFFRTMISDALEAQAMAKLLQLLGWTWVGLVSADDDFGRFAMQILMEELRGTGVCVAYHQVVPKVKKDLEIGVLTSPEAVAKSTFCGKLMVIFCSSLIYIFSLSF